MILFCQGIESKLAAWGSVVYDAEVQYV